MRIALTVLIGLATLVPLAAQDEPAIRAVVQKYLDAREKRDAKAVDALFVANADQLVSSGEWLKGRDAVVKGTLASSDSASGKRTITVESVRLVTRDVAVADGRYELAGSNGADTRKMWTTFIMTRTPAGWKIAAIRNMLPAAPAGGR